MTALIAIHFRISRRRRKWQVARSSGGFSSSSESSLCSRTGRHAVSNTRRKIARGHARHGHQVALPDKDPAGLTLAAGASRVDCCAQSESHPIPYLGQLPIRHRRNRQHRFLRSLHLPIWRRSSPCRRNRKFVDSTSYRLPSLRPKRKSPRFLASWPRRWCRVPFPQSVRKHQTRPLPHDWPCLTREMTRPGSLHRTRIQPTTSFFPGRQNSHLTIRCPGRVPGRLPRKFHWGLCPRPPPRNRRSLDREPPRMPEKKLDGGGISWRNRCGPRPSLG